MPWFDMPLEQLREYRTETAEPPEFDAWWQLRLDQARAQAHPPVLARYEADIYGPVEVYDAEFSGAGGDRIRAWYLRSAGANGQTPVVVMTASDAPRDYAQAAKHSAMHYFRKPTNLADYMKLGVIVRDLLSGDSARAGLVAARGVEE